MKWRGGDFDYSAVYMAWDRPPFWRSRRSFLEASRASYPSRRQLTSSDRVEHREGGLTSIKFRRRSLSLVKFLLPRCVSWRSSFKRCPSPTFWSSACFSARSFLCLSFSSNSRCVCSEESFSSADITVNCRGLVDQFMDVFLEGSAGRKRKQAVVFHHEVRWDAKYWSFFEKEALTIRCSFGIRSVTQRCA